MNEPANDKKQPHESWESFADRRIRAAQEAGEFDRLPGFGQPLPDLGDPSDENWWVKRKLRDEKLNALPPMLEVRLEAERVLAAVWSLATEYQVRRRLTELNEKIRAAHFSPAPGPPVAVSPVDIEAIVLQWHARRSPNRP